MMTASAPDSITGSPAMECPECRGPVTRTDKICPACGVDLALAALLAEQGVWASVPSTQLKPMAEQLVLPRFGEFLLKNGFISENQLHMALAEQAAATHERPRPLGQILLEMGVVSREQLDVAAIQQVRQLQELLLEDNRQLQRHVNNYVQELWHALRKLDDLNQLKSNFLATIRHELRTPLSNIKGYTELLAHGYIGEISAEQKEAVEVINQAAAHLEQLINDLIRFTSSAKGELTLEEAPFSLAELAARLLGSMSAKAAASQVTLTIEIPPNLPPVLGDKEKIYWVLFHLLDNAIKFTPSGGEVHLGAAPGPKVRLHIQDTGIGIPPDRIREIFEPFHQLDGSSTRAYGGLGLGLALVRRVVEMHGSQIEVESRPGQGSLFTFDLPVAAV